MTMHQNKELTASVSVRHAEVEPIASDLTPIAIAARGKEITGLRIFQRTTDDITVTRVEELLLAMNTDQPTGGVDMTYGKGDAQHLRFWKPKSSNAPIILFVHGGSWQSGTYMDSLGYLVINATRLDFDPQRIILMGHSSSAHIVTLLELTEDIWRTQESISIPCTLSSLLTAHIKTQ
jgi:acetyl esterase/lipase